VNAFDLHARRAGFVLDAAASWEAPVAALFGPSGAGKSSVLEALAGLRPEIVGEVTLCGRRVDGLPPELRRVGWVPQEAALFPHRTVAGNLAFAERAAAARRKDRPASRAAVERAVEALEIGPLLERRADALSGGERQRVAIARALASEPDLLLLDEPLASVDRPLRARIVPFLARLPQATGVPMLLVSHDPLEVLALASHVIAMSEGRVVAQGAAREVLPAGASLGSLEVLAAENLFEVAVVEREEGVLHLRTAQGCPLQMAAVAGFPDPARVAVRAEDVMLAAERPAAVSAQNVLRGRVEGLATWGQHVDVSVLAGGETWIVRVTERAVRQLGLRPGAAAHLLVKAHALHSCT
jgi:molybdate transport system ATP-binding protein